MAKTIRQLWWKMISKLIAQRYSIYNLAYKLIKISSYSIFFKFNFLPLIKIIISVVSVQLKVFCKTVLLLLFQYITDIMLIILAVLQARIRVPVLFSIHFNHEILVNYIKIKGKNRYIQFWPERLKSKQAKSWVNTYTATLIIQIEDLKRLDECFNISEWYLGLDMLYSLFENQMELLFFLSSFYFD